MTNTPYIHVDYSIL